MTVPPSGRPAGARGPRRPSGDQGTVLVLVLGLSVVLMALVVVVVDVSVVLLHQRGVASAADGAAVAGAQEINEDAFFAGGLAGGRVPLEQGAVRRAVARYAAEVSADTRLDASVQGGTTVVVEGSRVVELPFSRYVGRGRVTVTAVARAQSPVVG